MAKLALFLADGCEEIEALTQVDLLRRAGIEVVTVSIMEKATITGSHKIQFIADKMYDEMSFDDIDGLILPGGMPGTNHLADHEKLGKLLVEFNQAGKLVAAICAAPSVLGKYEILDGKRATCYPGFEDKLGNAFYTPDPAVQDGNIITGRGMGASIDFGLKLVSYFTDESVAEDLAQKIVFTK